METVADFIFLGSKIIMDLDSSHRIKRHLLLGRKKGYEKLAQCIKKQRHYFSYKVHLVKAVVFPIVMYGCESLTIKRAER